MVNNEIFMMILSTLKFIFPVMSVHGVKIGVYKGEHVCV